MIKHFAIFTLLILLLNTGSALAQEELAVAPTAAGDVHLVREGKTRFLVHNNQKIYSGSEYLDIFKFFNNKSYDAMILTDFSGPIICPREYIFVSLRAPDIVVVSPPLAHCSRDPNVSQKKNKIIIEFKPFGSLPGAVWELDGLKLSRVK